MPGVGPVLAFGLAGSLVGAVGGGTAGGTIEDMSTRGLPEDICQERMGTTGSSDRSLRSRRRSGTDKRSLG